MLCNYFKNCITSLLMYDYMKNCPFYKKIRFVIIFLDKGGSKDDSNEKNMV